MDQFITTVHEIECRRNALISAFSRDNYIALDWYLLSDGVQAVKCMNGKQQQQMADLAMTYCYSKLENNVLLQDIYLNEVDKMINEMKVYANISL